MSDEKKNYGLKIGLTASREDLSEIGTGIEPPVPDRAAKPNSQKSTDLYDLQNTNLPPPPPEPKRATPDPIYYSVPPNPTDPEYLNSDISEMVKTTICVNDQVSLFLSDQIRKFLNHVSKSHGLRRHSTVGPTEWGTSQSGSNF